MYSFINSLNHTTMTKKEVINQLVKLGIKVTKSVEQTAGNVRAKLTEYQLNHDIDNINLGDVVNAGKKKVINLFKDVIDGLK